jgi:hypothetical protein
MLFVGDDWAEDHHDIEIENEAGRRLARKRLPEGLAGITQLHALIAGCMPAEWADLPGGEAAERVKVGIETERGPWVAALFDLAILTLGHQEHLGDVVAGYATDVDRDLIRAWWAMRCLTNVRWLAEHGYGSPEEFPEVAVLRSRS